MKTNTITKVAMVAAFAVTAIAARADYTIRWGVEDAELQETSTSVSFCYAMFAAKDASGKVEHLYNVDDDSEQNNIAIGENFIGTSTLESQARILGSQLSSTDMYIELYDINGAVLGYSVDHWSFSELQGSGFIASGDSATAGENVLWVSKFTEQVPEPTSGLLALLGFALLGLKRKAI